MPLILIASDRFADHQTPPGHPESPERAEVMDTVTAAWRGRGGEVVAPRAATREQLGRVHGVGHLRHMAETAGVAVALDSDTFTSPDTHDTALRAAGAAVDAVERVMAAADHRAFALVRPPGHHAERDRAMGFCFYNNVAVGAAHARALGASRVAIVDYDVHHGNGTQHIFDQDPDVLYVSLHQFPYYPGTGAAEEIGRGPGAGATVNVPLEAGALDDDYRVVFGELVVPVLRQFNPDLILVSAGFDAHEQDPLGGMRLTTPAFAAMMCDLRGVAEECCGGRIAAILEGGYHLGALEACMEAVVSAMTPDRAEPAGWPSPPGAETSRARAALAVVKLALRDYWRLD